MANTPNIQIGDDLQTLAGTQSVSNIVGELTINGVPISTTNTLMGNVTIGTEGANTLGFFGADGNTQYFVTFPGGAPTLSGVYADDVAALQGYINQMYASVLSIVQGLESYNLFTD